MTVSVIICSHARPQMLSETLAALARQTQTPDEIILSVVTETDLPECGPQIRVCTGTKGSCVQRNRALDRLWASTDIVVFIDDDYLAHPTAIAEIVQAFQTHGDVVGITGHLLADGIGTGGLTAQQARDILRDAPAAAPEILQDNMPALYGCNMAFRADALRDIRFDEAMPLYGWQEDVDFSARVSGRKIKIATWRGVHCGVRAGRTAHGGPLGYSQIANPFYIWRKGSITVGFALRLMGRNLISNAYRSLRPEPWIDRRGRLWGNALALWDVVRGRSRPDRILALQNQFSGVETPQHSGHGTDGDLLDPRQVG